MSATTLADTGSVYVTGRAMIAYARARDLQEEEARRELTRLLMGARRKGPSQTGAEQWRARTRSLGVDVTAHVVPDEVDSRIQVVTHVAVRPVAGRRR